jgi:HD-GYP domain-containing protein (c-di-GMP phosphodiesterase class II)
VWEEVLRGHDEPELGQDELTEVLEAVADYADLKSPSWMGHSRGVATLARAAGAQLRLPEPDLLLLYRAGLVHDLGVTGVSSLVWDQPRGLSGSERERVRTHPYLTERVLARPGALAQIGALAALHHERLDGSGYPRGLRAESLSKPARVLAAADVMQALGEDRPHRPAHDPAQRPAVLRAEVAAGRLDGEAVNAVLAASGHRVRRKAELPAGLTAREVEVLVMVASGLPNKQVAQQLNVSARTVGSHLEHAYAKIGVSTRGAAAMYVMRHGLVPEKSVI